MYHLIAWFLIVSRLQTVFVLVHDSRPCAISFELKDNFHDPTTCCDFIIIGSASCDLHSFLVLNFR